MQGLVALKASKSPAKLQEPQEQAAAGLPGWIGPNGSRATSHCNADASAFVARDACYCSWRSWCSLITKATDRLLYDRCTGPWRRAPGNSAQVLRPILTRLCRATFRDPHADRRTQQLRQHLRGQSHQLLISSQQHGRSSARQSQIKAVVNRVI